MRLKTVTTTFRLCLFLFVFYSSPRDTAVSLFVRVIHMSVLLFCAAALLCLVGSLSMEPGYCEWSTFKFMLNVVIHGQTTNKTVVVEQLALKYSVDLLKCSSPPPAFIPRTYFSCWNFACHQAMMCGKHFNSISSVTRKHETCTSQIWRGRQMTC